MNTAPATQHKGTAVVRIECTIHEAHAGQAAYIRTGAAEITPETTCELVRLAHSRWAKAASVQQNGPWPASDVEQA